MPLQITNQDGDEIPVMKETAVIFPWDYFHFLWNTGKFLQWVSDRPAEANARTTEYWRHCETLEFFQQLSLEPQQYGTCVPLFFHTDGVKIYKNQKAWLYSLSSACRKGQSTATKLVFIMVRDATVIKPDTHDAIGKLVAYICDTLMSGCFPRYDFEGKEFEPRTLAAERAGRPFAGNWSMAFAGFKGDWEARALVHKMTRYYRTQYICEHCMASYKDDFTFGDFRPNAMSQSLRFSHSQFLLLNPAGEQSSWTAVKGWTKDRNLEVFLFLLQRILIAVYPEWCYRFR